METDDADVLLSGRLLRFDEAGGAVNANDETSCHLRVESARMTCFLHPQDTLDPRHNLMTGGIGGLVQVDYAV